MIELPKDAKIYFAVDLVNMHRSFDGLAMIAQEILKQNPLSSNISIFRNKRADKIKITFWDRNGFVIFYKRLEKGRFKYSKMNQTCLELSELELNLLLDGIDFTRLKPLPTLHYDFFG